jgi:hypothetical protein
MLHNFGLIAAILVNLSNKEYTGGFDLSEKFGQKLDDQIGT